MRRFLFLWIVLLCIDALASVAVTVGVWRQIDAGFAPLVRWTLAAPLQALLLLVFIPRLRGEHMPSIDVATSSSRARSLLRMALAAASIGAILVVARVIRVDQLVWLRVWFIALAVVALVLARQRSASTVATAALLVLVALNSAGVVPLPFAFRVPTVIRWVVGYGAIGVVLVLLLLRLADRERGPRPAASAAFEWSLVPALAATLVVAANIFWRPFLTPGSALLAQMLGLAAATLIAVGAVAMHAKPDA